MLDQHEMASMMVDNIFDDRSSCQRNRAQPRDRYSFKIGEALRRMRHNVLQYISMVYPVGLANDLSPDERRKLQWVVNGLTAEALARRTQAAA